MNKEKLIERIKRIPKFVLRDIAIQQALDKTFGEDGLVTYNKGEYSWIESENWKAVTEEDKLLPIAFVGKRYNLINFDSVFLPLIENIPELEGNVLYFHGMGLMDVFPTEERLIINGGDKIGMVSLNSVNTTISVIVKFCVSHDGRIITIPNSLAGFKRMHVGKAFQVTQNFLTVVDKVRNIWKTMLNEFGKVIVDETYAQTMMDDVKIKEEYLRKKVIKAVTEKEMNVWDVFMLMMGVIEDRSFKSDYHRRKKLDLISDKLFKWVVTCRLINA